MNFQNKEQNLMFGAVRFVWSGLIYVMEVSFQIRMKVKIKRSLRESLATKRPHEQ